MSDPLIELQKHIQSIGDLIGSPDLKLPPPPLYTKHQQQSRASGARGKGEELDPIVLDGTVSAGNSATGAAATVIYKHIFERKAVLVGIYMGFAVGHSNLVRYQPKINGQNIVQYASNGNQYITGNATVRMLSLRRYVKVGDIYSMAVENYDLEYAHTVRSHILVERDDS